MPLGAVDAGLGEAVLKWGAHAVEINHEEHEAREDFPETEFAKIFVLFLPVAVQMPGL
jgi:heterodisulfide reductase subunit C